MSLISWDESLSVNVTRLDNQHKEIIATINSLDEAITADQEVEVIEGILNKLINYVTTHFKAEEFLFEEFGYPDRKEHIEEHNEFIKKVIKLKRDYDSGKLTLTSKVVVYLSEWADDHIRGLDQEYSAFFSWERSKSE